jgi:hypothetical protein
VRLPGSRVVVSDMMRFDVIGSTGRIAPYDRMEKPATSSTKLISAENSLCSSEEKE